MSNPDAYSWCKAPRLDGRVAEVGALSRQLVAGHPLLRDMVAREGASVEARVVARVIEIALVTMAMEQWIAAIDPRRRFRIPRRGLIRGCDGPDRGGAGQPRALAAARWRRITHYQIIAPTTWNFSPRDAAGTPDRSNRRWWARRSVPARPNRSRCSVVRSFDPCMVCTVH
jgi:hydrogenase large subunit